MLYRLLSLIGLSFALNGCIESHSETNNETTLIEKKPQIKLGVIKTQNFNYSIRSRGKLMAKKTAVLKFNKNEIITTVKVNNGDIVKKGDIIAIQDSYGLKLAHSQNQVEYKKCRIQMEDMLLGYGYNIKDSISVPKSTWDMVSIRSGVSIAETNLLKSQYELDMSILRSPISGMVSNLNVKENNIYNNSESVCKIVNNSQMILKFFILEQEYGMIKINDKVEVSTNTFSDKVYSGKVVNINPAVGENGMILIQAKVQNTDGKLIEGMNAELIIINQLKDKIILPKEAIVDRKGKKVVFTYSLGEAKWNYVKLGMDTRDSVIITDGINVGDEVIIDGNSFLAHKTKVNRVE